VASYPTPHTVTVHAWEALAVDAHGNPMEMWAEPGDTVGVYGWAPPSPDTETLGGRDAVTRQLDLLVPPGFTIGPHDQITVDGVRYDVVGYLEDFTHGPFGWRPGGRVNLQRAEG
jgi:hypothetical protein